MDGAPGLRRALRGVADGVVLRACCALGLHFLAWDFQRDGYFCECGQQRLHGEDIRQ